MDRLNLPTTRSPLADSPPHSEVSAELGEAIPNPKSDTGYRHPAYARSWTSVGLPRYLPNSDCWVIQRQIPASTSTDVAALWPFLTCRNWHRLEQDLRDLADENISFAFVTDPFGEFDVGRLRECCGNGLVHFKDHFVTDLHRRPEEYRSTHHRRNVIKAMRQVTVEKVDGSNLDPWLETWKELYANLVRRHSIRESARLSAETLIAQFTVPRHRGFRRQIRGGGGGNRGDGVVVHSEQRGPLSPRCV